MGKVCSCYCGVACVDGNCPIANRDEYYERGMDVPHSCEDCYRYEGCDDCAFFGTDICSHELEEGVLN